MTEHYGRAGAPRGHAGTGGMPGTGGERMRGRARGGGRGRQAGRDGAAGRTGGGGPGPACGGPRTGSGRRRADAQHLAERAEQPPGLGCGGEQVGHRRIGEQVLQLRGGGGGLRQPAQQPGDAARQPERLGPGRTGRAQAAARRRQRAGTDFCREAGEPLRGAAQPRPEQQHQRHGETQAHAAGGEGAAQPLDQRGKTVGQGGGRGGRHDSDTNTARAGGWASRPGHVDFQGATRPPAVKAPTGKAAARLPSRQRSAYRLSR